MFCAKCGKEIPEGATFCPSCGASVQGTSQATASTVSGLDNLSRDSVAQTYWIRRVIAFVIDALIVDVALLIVTVILAVPLFIFSGTAAVAAIFAGVFSVVSGLVLVFYFSISEVVCGATLGKHFLNLRVTTTTGRTPNFGEAFIRNISKIYWLLLLLDVILGLATSKEYTQKFSDKFIGTKVVSR